MRVIVEEYEGGRGWRISSAGLEDCRVGQYLGLASSSQRVLRLTRLGRCLSVHRLVDGHQDFKVVAASVEQPKAHRLRPRVHRLWLLFVSRLAKALKLRNKLTTTSTWIAPS